jgi:hypothetical protein
MLNQNTFTRQAAVPLLFLLRQRMVFGFLAGCLTIFMKFRQPLIASNRQHPNVLRNIALVLPKKLKVMLAPIGKGGRHDFSGHSVSNQLRFLGMVPLFTDVMPVLAFFGRLIGCSLASTSTPQRKCHWAGAPFCLAGETSLSLPACLPPFGYYNKPQTR